MKNLNSRPRYFPIILFLFLISFESQAQPLVGSLKNGWFEVALCLLLCAIIIVLLALNQDDDGLVNEETADTLEQISVSPHYLHPPSLFVKEPYFSNLETGRENTEIANHYARRGSHWIEYHLAAGDFNVIRKGTEDDYDDEISGQYYIKKHPVLVVDNQALRKELENLELTAHEINDLIEKVLK